MFVPGERYPVIETSVGALGVEICYDLEFPEVARQLTTAGAEVLVTISANMSPFEEYQRVYRQARAMENGRPHVLCNRVGSERDDEYFGGSGVVDACGTVLVETDAAVETALTAEVSLGQSTDETLTYHEDRRIELEPAED